MTPCRSRSRLILVGAASGLAAAIALTGSGVWAQTQIPGLVVVVPPTDRAAPTSPPPAPPASESPKAKPKPKPEQKVEKKRPAATASADPDAGSGVISGSGSARAALKVNGEPITSYEVEQRARLLALQANLGSVAQERMKQIVASPATNDRWKQIVEDTIKSNPGKTREQIMAILEKRRTELGASLQRQAMDQAKASVLPSLRRQAREELIQETVKLQEARKGNIRPDENEINNLINGLAQQNKMNAAQFEKHFAGMGVDVATLKAKFRANLAWAELIRRKYSYLVNPNQREIDKLVAGSQATEDDVELQLQRIIIPVPAKVDQRNMTQKFAEAEKLRSEFSGCKTLAGLAGKSPGARVENIGARRPSNFQEPSRTLLGSAKPGEMLPPNVLSAGVELLAVCDRKVIKANDKRREEAAADIRQKEFEILARRLLRDIQQDAIIENIGQ